MADIKEVVRLLERMDDKQDRNHEKIMRSITDLKVVDASLIARQDAQESQFDNYRKSTNKWLIGSCVGILMLIVGAIIRSVIF